MTYLDTMKCNVTNVLLFFGLQWRRLLCQPGRWFYLWRFCTFASQRPRRGRYWSLRLLYVEFAIYGPIINISKHCVFPCKVAKPRMLQLAKVCWMPGTLSQSHSRPVSSDKKRDACIPSCVFPRLCDN